AGAALVGGEARQVAALVEGRAAGQQGVGRRRPAVVLQRPDQRVLADDVVRVRAVDGPGLRDLGQAAVGVDCPVEEAFEVGALRGGVVCDDGTLQGQESGGTIIAKKVDPPSARGSGVFHDGAVEDRHPAEFHGDAAGSGSQVSGDCAVDDRCGPPENGNSTPLNFGFVVHDCTIGQDQRAVAIDQDTATEAVIRVAVGDGCPVEGKFAGDFDDPEG